MSNDQLRAIIDRAFARERISAEDVRELQREVFEHGLSSREEVNVLAALDRSIPTADPLWAKFFITSLVEFVVWTSRPTGYVDKETARWLVTALMPMHRGTVNAHRAALEIVREAQQVDEEILPLLLMPREIRPTYSLAASQPARTTAPEPQVAKNPVRGRRASVVDLVTGGLVELSARLVRGWSGRCECKAASISSRFTSLVPGSQRRRISASTSSRI